MRVFLSYATVVGLLTAGVCSSPGTSDIVSNLGVVARRSLLPNSPLTYSRWLAGKYGKRQTDCNSACSSASDTATFTQINNATCGLDTNCLCTEMLSLSSACLSCELSREGMTTAQFQSTCQAASSVISVGTAISSALAAESTGTGSCASQCGTDSEQAGLEAVASCGNSALCICSATNVTEYSALTSTCLSCILQQAGTTLTALQTMCNNADASPSAPAATPSQSLSPSTSASASQSQTSTSAAVSASSQESTNAAVSASSQASTTSAASASSQASTSSASASAAQTSASAKSGAVSWVRPGFGMGEVIGSAVMAAAFGLLL